MPTNQTSTIQGKRIQPSKPVPLILHGCTYREVTQTLASRRHSGTDLVHVDDLWYEVCVKREESVIEHLSEV